MTGFNLSTGSIDLISQPGDIPLDGGSSGPSCNHECPKCCPPEESEDGSDSLATLLVIIAVVALLFGGAAILGIYMSGPQY
jgi:hypothetical protein